MTELALYIDIEGFGCKFENGGKKSYINLTNDLYSLGRSLFNYLSIYQFGGDGFLIKENFHYYNSVSRFIDLSVALLQSITLRGGTGRVQISHGNMADISGELSKEIQKEINAEHHNILGHYDNTTPPRCNMMIINPIIGKAIINCAKLKGPKGPLLLVDKDLEEKMITEKVLYQKILTDKFEVLSVNWVNYKSENTELILQQLKLSNLNIKETIRTYIDTNVLPEEWKINALSLIQ
jgi:hypothetical protein